MQGAEATLIGYDGPDRVRRLADEANARFEVKMGFADGSTEEQNSAQSRVYLPRERATEAAFKKLAQQLRKYKERLTDHHRGERRTEVDSTVPQEPPSEPEATYEKYLEKRRQMEAVKRANIDSFRKRQAAHRELRLGGQRTGEGEHENEQRRADRSHGQRR